MPTESQVNRLTKDLIRQTIEGKLQWEVGVLPASLARGSSDIVDDYFHAVYKDETVGVYERKFRAYDAEHEESYWTSQARLAIVPDSGAVWDTADSSSIWTLFKVARDSAIDIDGIFDSLLKK